MITNEEAMTNEEAIKLLSQVRDAILASNSWLPSTDNPIKECFGMAVSALKAQQAAGDAISRQEAINALRTCYDTEAITYTNGNEYIDYDQALEEIEQLPSAQPEIIRCKECKFYRCDGCFFSTAETEENGFCSWAERRTDG